MEQIPWVWPGLAALLGLMVGSFLNVVIYRLPLMLEQSWRRDCEQFLEIEPASVAPKPFNLCLPHSHCVHCGHSIKWWDNFPLISFILLRGQCRYCQAAISWRYPLIELLTALLSWLVAWRFGLTTQAGAALFLTWCLLVLSVIDLQKQLLPDCINLPVLWLGLLASVFGLFVDSQTSIVGAVIGYLCLWLIYWLFKLVTGKEGMGYGDFKLLAMLGAWLGWASLPFVVLLSSLTGALIGVLMIVVWRHDRGQPIPFGPFIAISGWIALVFGVPSWPLLG